MLGFFFFFERDSEPAAYVTGVSERVVGDWFDALARHRRRPRRVVGPSRTATPAEGELRKTAQNGATRTEKQAEDEIGRGGGGG